MIELQQQGLGFRRIAAALDAAGDLPPTYGGKWQPTTVQRVLERHAPDLVPPRKR